MFNSFYAKTLKQYQEWISSSFRSPAVPDRVRDYLLHLAVESPAGKYLMLWPHQREAVLRAIFTNELLKPRDAGWKDLLLNVVTGGGKTTIIAAIMAYLRVCHEVRSFLLLSPNTIVRERLRMDFERPSRDDSVWRRFNLFPPEFAHFVHDMTLHVLEPGAGSAGIRSAAVTLGHSAVRHSIWAVTSKVSPLGTVTSVTGVRMLAVSVPQGMNHSMVSASVLESESVAVAWIRHWPESVMGRLIDSVK